MSPAKKNRRASIVRRDIAEPVAELPRPVDATARPTASDAVKTFLQCYTQAKVRQGSRRPPAFVDYEVPGRLPLTLPDPAEDQAVFWARLADATGSIHPEAQIRLMDELARVVGRESTAVHLMGAFAHMLDIGPRDGLEGMLAVQMVSVHRVAMNLLAAGSSGEQSLEHATFKFTQATRLMRLFAMQMDALNRNRGKAPSEQRVTVEHIQVHAGGQAVVGNVSVGPALATREPDPEMPPSGEGGGMESHVR